MKKIHLLVLIIIFLIAAVLRLYGNNWDSGQHLHPDERFLTMVVNDMKVPSSIFEYLDPSRSLFNPDNLRYDFFVYGVFPLTLVKILAGFLNLDNYGGIVLLGRYVSAICDILILFLVFLIALFFERKYKLSNLFSLFAVFFYALFVLPIQLAHFYAVDTFLTFFLLTSFYFALLFSERRSILYLLLCSFFWGLSLSSKVSAIYFLPLIFSILFFPILFSLPHGKLNWDSFQNVFTDMKHLLFGKLVRAVLLFCVFFVTSLVVTRFADPYIFEGTAVYDIRISSDFVHDLKTLKSFENPEGWFPPAVQWINKPAVIFSLVNIALFGVGIFSFLFVLFGMYLIGRKYRYIEFVIMLLWVLVFFVYQSSQFSKMMRYFYILYPFFAIFAGLAFSYVFYRINRVISIMLLVFCSLWTIAFISIYLKPHTRVSASHYIYNTVPQDKILLTEHWDDSLPLPVENPLKKNYIIEQLPVFGPDNTEKWSTMDDLLSKGDYLILSSNRGWGSIPNAPSRYPQTTTYYEQLLKNEHPQYKIIKVFSSYPSLSYLGVPISFPDDFADESFTVYDHPKVIIYKKMR